MKITIVHSGLKGLKEEYIFITLSLWYQRVLSATLRLLSVNVILLTALHLVVWEMQKWQIYSGGTGVSI